MSEPISSAAMATAIVTGATIAGLLSGPEAADVVIGAFIGSVIFVISAKDYPFATRTVLFVVSFVIGVVSSEFFANAISTTLPGELAVTKLIGAIVSSAVSVRLLMALTKRAADPDLLKKGGHNNEP
ncbi:MULTISPECIES: phage holin family protein [unclassified Serratia (in: enterobacteria)]|uniref:phage holin family protein n=1 Tax=unclassified Serratia (in: enterobacteria) TaxID=2647522 RepID=UPI0030765504